MVCYGGWKPWGQLSARLKHDEGPVAGTPTDGPANTTREYQGVASQYAQGWSKPFWGERRERRHFRGKTGFFWGDGDDMLSPCDRVASGACPESGCFRGHSSRCPSGKSAGRRVENLVMENHGDGKHRAPCPPWPLGRLCPWTSARGSPLTICIMEGEACVPCLSRRGGCAKAPRSRLLVAGQEIPPA